MKTVLLLSFAVALPLAPACADQQRPTLQRPTLQRLAPPEAASAAHARSAFEQAAGSNACLDLIPADPSGAADYAEDWSRRGGADMAMQCTALAQIALGDPDGGALILDSLSRNPALAPLRRAALANEASHAWLEAANPGHALTSATLAVSLAPSEPVLLIDRGRAALAAGHPDQAVADLSRVLARAPDRVDALVVRATAFRAMNRITEARADIDRACTALPDDPGALLERGILRERQGELDGARSDWIRVMAVAGGSHEADQAEQDLALLDAGPESR